MQRVLNRMPALVGSSLTCFLLSAGSAVRGAEPPTAIPLWSEGAPGSEDRMNEPENVDLGPGKCNVTNMHHPSITPYLPKAETATGTAVIIAPGGGHRVPHSRVVLLRGGKRPFVPVRYEEKS